MSVDMLSVVVPALAALAGAFVGNYLPHRTTIKQRTADLRRPAYSAILQALEAAQMRCNVANGVLERESANYLNSSHIQDDISYVWKQIMLACSLYRENYLVASSPFIAIFLKFDAETPENADNPLNELEGLSEVLATYVPKLREQARSEVGLP